LPANALQTCYAMAETVFAISQSKLGSPVRRLAVDRESLQTAGRVVPPAAGSDPLVLLSNGRPVQGCKVVAGEPGQVGEIRVTAPFLFSGYHNNPAATEAAFDGAWFRTGDLGFVDNGEVFVVGRLKDVIIVNGKNIFAHDIEAAVARLPGLKPGRAVAFGSYSPGLGSEELVVVAERLDRSVPDEELIRSITIAVHQEVSLACSDVLVVDQGWLVKTTSGKISRSANARKYAATRT
jgi:fatty-acyl-CoA synthase